MKIDTSLLNAGADQFWMNTRQNLPVSPVNRVDQSTDVEAQESKTASAESHADSQNYPTMKSALRKLTSSRIFRDASSHIQFASNLNHQRVMAERVEHLTSI
jgi:hypothetical protein